MTRTFAFAATASMFLFAGSATAQTPLTGDLKLVPGDAAVFGYLDVAKLLKSKVGDAVRNLEVPNDIGVDEFDKKPTDANVGKTVKPYGAFVRRYLLALIFLLVAADARAQRGRRSPQAQWWAAPW